MVSAVISVVSAVTAVWALWYTHRQVQFGSRQQQRAVALSTLDAYATWADDMRDLRRRLYETVGGDATPSSRVEALATSADARYSARSVVNGLERLAVGARAGLYDDRVLWLIGRSVIFNVEERLYTPLCDASVQPERPGYRSLPHLFDRMRHLSERGEDACIASLYADAV